MAAYIMEESMILLALSMIKTCQEDETVAKLPCPNTARENMTSIRHQLLQAKLFIAQEAAGTNTCIDQHWIQTVYRLAFSVKVVMHKYLYHARQMQGNPDPEHPTESLDCIFKWVEQIKNCMDKVILLEEFSIVHSSPLLIADQNSVSIAQELQSDEDTQYIDGQRRVDSLKKMINESQKGIVFVYGIAGIGKTALVEKVYKDVQTTGGYQKQAYVSLSKKPGTPSALEDIACQIKVKLTDNMGQQDIARQIKLELKNKSYILVIDDVREEQTWKAIQTALPNNKQRKSIVVAVTRRDDIAIAYSSEKDRYEIKPLNEDESKDLATKLGITDSYRDVIIGEECSGVRTADEEGSEEHVDEQAVSDELQGPRGSSRVKKNTCVPLVLKNIASLLSAKSVGYVKEPAGRQQVLDKTKGTLFTNCSMYLSMLPKNSKVERESMIRKWIAEGLLHDEGRDERNSVQDEGTGKSLEKTAGEIFERLVKENMVQPVDYGYYCPEEDVYIPSKKEENDVYYEVNSQTLEALRKISQERCSALDSLVGKTSVIDKEGDCLLPAWSMTLPVRFPSVDLFYDQLMVLDLEGRENVSNDAVAKICTRMILLRYLGLRNTNISVLPPEINNLQILETLDVRETELKELPENVKHLSKLTLLLVGGSGKGRPRCCKVLDVLPTSIKKVKKAECESVPSSIEDRLSGLTFLEITVAELEREGLVSLGKISSLQTLVLQVLVGFCKEKVAIKVGDGFKKLENFMLDCHEPWVEFKKGAMPNVKHLGLKLYAGPLDKTPTGIEHLEKLKKVTLQYSSRYRGSACVRQTIETIKHDVRELNSKKRKLNPNDKNRVTLSINGKDTDIEDPWLAYMGKLMNVIVIILLVQVFGAWWGLASMGKTVTQPGSIRGRLFRLCLLTLILFLLYCSFGILCLFNLILCLLLLFIYVAKQRRAAYLSFQRARSE